MRASRPSVFSSPVLVGSITVLVTVVGVFLAYNANKGLPFVPTYDVTAQLPSASGLIHGNEIRIGGARVGIVATVTPRARRDNSAGAEVQMRLEKSVEPLPADSTLRVRPRSPLGLKYIELTRGRSSAGIPNHGTIDATRQPIPVEFDDFFNTFNAPTRAASQANLNEFGDAFAGRGSDLNRFFAQLDPLVHKLEPVMRNINDPRTRWGQFFAGMAQAADEVVPVAATQADLYVALDTTFKAWASVRGPFKAAISGGPPALRTATRELPAQAAFVRANTELFRRWRPALGQLAAASVDLAPAFRTGEPALRHATALNHRFVQTMDDLRAFAAAPGIVRDTERLTQFARLLGRPLSALTPAQTTCNYLALFVHNLASSLSESDVIGSYLRVGILALPQLPNSEA